MKKNQRKSAAKLAFRFVVIIGIANLFADLTYEGARSITGPFLGSLGASATVIGFVVGFGELLGYSLRSISGFFADKTHKYWVVTFVGYFINMLAVPALARRPFALHDLGGRVSASRQGGVYRFERDARARLVR